MEGQDSPVAPGDLTLSPRAEVTAVAQAGLLGGVTTLAVTDGPATAFTAVPYYAWNNRGLAPMAVWLKRGT